MTPSPSYNHQKMVGNFFGVLRDKLKGSPCVPIVAPMDVYFDDNNFVQPDVMVVCGNSKIKDKVFGAPDLVVEVLSPSTSLKDKREKKILYERFGVKEYIICYPEESFLERYCLDGQRYQEPAIFGPQETFSLFSLNGLEIPTWELFGMEPPE